MTATDVLGDAGSFYRPTPLILAPGSQTSPDVEVIQRINKLPEWLHETIMHLPKWVKTWDGESDDDYEMDDANDGRREVAHPAQAHLFSSRSAAEGDEHVLMLDIDCQVAALPSSTPGHHHLVFNGEFAWEDVKDLLLLMQKMGLLGQGFVEQSIRRKQTFLRLPWIKKGAEVDYQRAAMTAYLDGQIEPWERERERKREAF